MVRYSWKEYREFTIKVRRSGHGWVNAHSYFPERTVKALETALSDAARRLGYRMRREIRIRNGKKEIWTRYTGLIPTARKIRHTTHDPRKKVIRA